VSVLRVTKQDIFTRGNHFPLNRTPDTPCHHSTSHPRASSHEDTPPRDLSLSHVPATGTSHGEHLGSILRQDLSFPTHHRSCSVDSTLTTHPRLTPRSPQVHYQVIIRFTAPRALSHTPLTHQHHIIDIMRAGVRLQQGKWLKKQ
jgi:hypothetical protein